MNREKFENAGPARNSFPLTSFLSLGERRNHSAPWVDNGRGRFRGAMRLDRFRGSLPLSLGPKNSGARRVSAGGQQRFVFGDSAAPEGQLNRFATQGAQVVMVQIGGELLPKEISQNLRTSVVGLFADLGLSVYL